MDDLYTPVYGGVDCRQCHDVPCVGLQTEEGVTCTGLCGVCFFQDRTMIDIDLWNSPKDSTE